MPLRCWSRHTLDENIFGLYVSPAAESVLIELRFLAASTPNRAGTSSSLWTLSAQYAEEDLWSGLASVRLSVCPVNWQQQRHAAGLLLSVPRVGDIDRQQASAPPQHDVQQQMRAVSCWQLRNEAEHRHVKYEAASARLIRENLKRNTPSYTQNRTIRVAVGSTVHSIKASRSTHLRQAYNESHSRLARN